MKLGNLTNKMFKNIISLVAREEVFDGDFYKTIHSNFAKPHHVFMSEAIEMASGGRLKSEEAKIAAMALSGQIMRFISSQKYLQLNIGWKSFSEKEANKICDTLLKLLDKILA